MDVLHIENNGDDCALVREWLGRAPGWTVSTADTLADGLELLRSSRFNVFLVDLDLPGTSKREVLSALGKMRSQGAVIIYSGSPDQEDVVACIDAGCDKFIPKKSIRQAKEFVAALRIACEKFAARDFRRPQRVLTMEEGEQLDRVFTALFIDLPDKPCFQSEMARMTGEVSSLRGWIGDVRDDVRAMATKIAEESSGRTRLYIIGMLLNAVVVIYGIYAHATPETVKLPAVLPEEHEHER